MTMPHERARAVLQTREFLQELSVTKKSNIPAEIRLEAERLLRHYPNVIDMEITAKVFPALWALQDP